MGRNLAGSLLAAAGSSPLASRTQRALPCSNSLIHRNTWLVLRSCSLATDETEDSERVACLTTWHFHSGEKIRRRDEFALSSISMHDCKLRITAECLNAFQIKDVMTGRLHYTYEDGKFVLLWPQPATCLQKLHRRDEIREYQAKFEKQKYTLLSHEDFKRLIKTTWLTSARSYTESAINV